MFSLYSDKDTLLRFLHAYERFEEDSYKFNPVPDLGEGVFELLLSLDDVKHSLGANFDFNCDEAICFSFNKEIQERVFIIIALNSNRQTSSVHIVNADYDLWDCLEINGIYHEEIGQNFDIPYIKFKDDNASDVWEEFFDTSINNILDNPIATKRAVKDFCIKNIIHKNGTIPGSDAEPHINNDDDCIYVTHGTFDEMRDIIQSLCDKYFIDYGVKIEVIDVVCEHDRDCERHIQIYPTNPYVNEIHDHINKICSYFFPYGVRADYNQVHGRGVEMYPELFLNDRRATSAHLVLHIQDPEKTLTSHTARAKSIDLFESFFKS